MPVVFQAHAVAHHITDRFDLPGHDHIAAQRNAAWRIGLKHCTCGQVNLHGGGVGVAAHAWAK